VENLKATVEDTGTGISGEGSDTHGIASLGVGLIFNNISVRPNVVIPVGLDGADPTLGLTVGYNFGRYASTLRTCSATGAAWPLPFCFSAYSIDENLNGIRQWKPRTFAPFKPHSSSSTRMIPAAPS
jgi:hypothetical protein